MPKKKKEEVIDLKQKETGEYAPEETEERMLPVKATEDAIDIEIPSLKKRFTDLREFQEFVKAQMIPNVDYGIIKGTEKPTLLKPGAEKIVKLLVLSDHHFIEAKLEDWDKPFFHYQTKTILRSIKTGKIISEGIGSCNSLESKYRWRWVYDNQVPPELKSQKDSFLSRSKYSHKYKKYYTQYRIPNDDIFSLVNTLQKMAKKRSMVDAALSVGRLSDIYTQDMEDLTGTDLQDAKDASEDYGSLPEEKTQKKQSKPATKPKPAAEEKPKVQPKPEPKPEPKKEEHKAPEESPAKQQPEEKLEYYSALIKQDFKARYPGKSDKEYQEFKRFLGEFFNNHKEMKFVGMNNWKHWSIQEGKLKDVEVMMAHFAWVISQYEEWKKNQPKEGEIPF